MHDPHFTRRQSSSPLFGRSILPECFRFSTKFRIYLNMPRCDICLPSTAELLTFCVRRATAVLTIHMEAVFQFFYKSKVILIKY